MKNIFFFFVIVSFSFGIDFYRTDNRVVDVAHKLLWQDTTDNTKILKNQNDAIKYCEDLELDGLSDWRLPSVKEFEHIIDKTRKHNEPKIQKQFQYVLLDQYWLKDKTWRNFFKWGYYVFLKSGSIYYENNTYLKYVRCVTDGVE